MFGNGTESKHTRTNGQVINVIEACKANDTNTIKKIRKNLELNQEESLHRKPKKDWPPIGYIFQFNNCVMFSFHKVRRTNRIYWLAT